MKTIRSLLATALWLGTMSSPAVAHCPDYSVLKNAYFGDLHNHTSFSLDAYNFGTRTDPAQSYAFATGAAVDIGLGYDPTTNEVPGPFGVTIDFSGGRLDFGAVTDHSEWLATDYGCTVDPTSPFYDVNYCQQLRNAKNGPVAETPCAGTTDIAQTGCQQEQTRAWAAENQATEAANHACSFTSFHAFEWTYSLGTTDDDSKQTLHKNVFFRNTSVPAVPIDSFDYPSSPTLWAALAQQCNGSTGCEALTIPHNMNQSNGLAFQIGGYTATDLNRMMKYQRLVELHQHKANSECLTDTVDGGATVACDFEVNPELTQAVDAPGYARAALEQGITRYATRGYDPLKFGFVGATDNHDGTMGNVAEDAWPGFIGARDNTPRRRLTRNPFKTNPGGITGIWAEENTREALWAALQRRETFATSGPKIAVRFYEYTGLPNPCADPTFPAQVVAGGGVPMGGTIPSYSGAPSFVVYALQDQVPLASVDIVKGTYSGGGQTAVETVYPITFASAPYCVTWTDPAFDPAQPAFYYARVKEQPTWRWSHYDCLSLKASNPANWQTIAPGCASSDPSTGGLDFMIQERAWTSSIWFLPGGPVTIQSTALKLRDGSAVSDPGKRRFTFKSSTRRDAPDHRIVVPAPGSAGDPTATGGGGGGASLTVFNPDSGETFTAALPAANWKLAGTHYDYRDPHGAISRVSVSADRMVVKGGGAAFGYSLDEPRQGAVALRLQLGNATPWCAEASAKASGNPPVTTKSDKPDRFTAQSKAPAPEQCPILGSPGGAFVD